MNKKYKELFTLIANNLEITAEKAMEQNQKNNDLNAYKVSKEMRSKYARLHDLLRSEQVNYVLTSSDYADLFIGSFLSVQQLKEQKKQIQMVIDGYENDLMPKLKELTECKENIEELAEKLFEISDLND